MTMATTIYTIGHSNRTIDEFIAMLTAHDIAAVVDVRTIAKSRHNPQFGETALRRSLATAGIAYSRLEKLGGLRRTNKDSVNTAWRNKSFRGYADYMQTPEFWEGLHELMDKAKKQPTAIMCAEAVPWRCHRSLIGDALLIKGVAVQNIMSEKTAKPHVLTPFAKVNKQTITYPDEA